MLKTLEGPLDCKEIQPVHPKGDQSWIFIGRIDAEAETPTLWPLQYFDVKNWLNGKDPVAGKDWRQEENGTTEHKMVGSHHTLMDMSLSKLQELVIDRETLLPSVYRISKSWTWLSDWIELNALYCECDMIGASLVTQMVKYLPERQETHV